MKKSLIAIALICSTPALSAELGGRPEACYKWKATRHLWCGCATALEVGLDNSDGFWNLARNYFSLPRAEPGHNKVVVRSGHVAVLKSHVKGSIWLAYDPNSGGGLARLHEIDIRRYRAVVDPSGAPTRTASAKRRFRHEPHPRANSTTYTPEPGVLR